MISRLTQEDQKYSCRGPGSRFMTNVIIFLLLSVFSIVVFNLISQI